jgi:hypothetical protein
MSYPTVERIAVVVALNDPPTPALGARLARFVEEVGPLGEVLMMDASGTPRGVEIAGRFANVRAIARPVGRLAPMLWRDGLLSTDADLVAFTTAQMIPRPGWLASLVRQLRTTNAAGVGGPIEPGSSLSKTDRAVALLRYSSYFPPVHSGVIGSGGPPDEGKPARHPHASPSLQRLLDVDPPGDNALYRRDRLMAVESAWLGGFWEVEVHEALRDRGEALAMSESAVVSFEGGVGLSSTARRRVGHALRYAAGRSKGLGPTARLARALAAPLVPALLCGRIVAALRSRGMGPRPWLSAVPRLILLATAWAFGEAVGTLIPTARPRFLVQRPGPATPIHRKARSWKPTGK